MQSEGQEIFLYDRRALQVGVPSSSQRDVQILPMEPYEFDRLAPSDPEVTNLIDRLSADEALLLGTLGRYDKVFLDRLRE